MVVRLPVSVARLLMMGQRCIFSMAVACHRAPQVIMPMIVGCVTNATAYARHVRPNTIVSRVLWVTFMMAFVIVHVH